VDAGAYRAKTERRIDELNASLQRERVELAVAQGALETTRRDYARLQRDILAGRGAPQRGATLEEVSDTAKEPSKSRNGRGGGRGPKAVEVEPEGGSGAPVHPIISFTTKLPSARATARARRNSHPAVAVRPSFTRAPGCQGGGALPADLDGCIDIAHFRVWRERHGPHRRRRSIETADALPRAARLARTRRQD